MILKNTSMPTINVCYSNFLRSYVFHLASLRYFYRPHPTDREGNIFSLCVSSQPRGWGVYSICRQRGGGGGLVTPHQVLDWGGGYPYPSLWWKVPASFPIGGGTPIRIGCGTPSLLGLDGGTLHPVETGWG